MSLTKFLISISAVTLFSWIAWGTVLVYIDPELAGGIGISVFYASLFFSLLGTFILLGLVIRIVMRRLHRGTVIAFQFISPSIRQSIWFSLAIIVCLMLSASNLFNWWSLTILMVGLVILEAFFLTNQTNKRVS